MVSLEDEGRSGTAEDSGHPPDQTRPDSNGRAPDPRRVHAETARAWDAIAASKSRSELESRIARLRAGGHTLLDVMAALSRAGLRHEHYAEHPDLFWNQFLDWPDHLRSRLPHSYSLLYRRPVPHTSGSP